MESTHNTSGPAEMDSCVMITDETVLADQSASATTSNQPLHSVSKPSAAGGDASAASRTVAENAEVSETTAKSTSRLFDLVNADSPVAEVS